MIIPNTDSFTESFNDEAIEKTINDAFDFYHDNYLPELSDEVKQETTSRVLNDSQLKQTIVNLMWEYIKDNMGVGSDDDDDDIFCGHCDSILDVLGFTSREFNYH